MTARIFAILSAVFLVVAVGIAALTPLGLTLGQGLLMANPTNLEWLRANSSAWFWAWIEAPFLLRPLWFLPVCMGVVCAGIATTLNFGKASSTRRRRS